VRNDVMRTAIALLVLMTLGAGTAAADATDPILTSGSYYYVVDHITQVDRDAEIMVWMTLPGDRPGQKLKFRNFYPQPVEIVRDHEFGNRLAIWRLEPDDDTEHLIMRYEFDVELTGIQSRVDPHAVAPIDASTKLHKLYTRSEAWLDFDGAVHERARSIVGAETNPYLQAKLIYVWLRDNLDFVPGGTHGQAAADVLSDLKGDCGQFSRLFAAMCRSLGIPSRTVTTQNVFGGLHRHAEFHVDPYGWLPVDISVAQTLKPGGSVLSEAEAEALISSSGLEGFDADWVFGNLPANYLAISVGNNIQVPLGNKSMHRKFVVMEPGGIHAVPQAARFTGVNDDLVHGGFFHFGEPLTSEAVMTKAHQKLASLYLDAGMVDEVEEGCLTAQADQLDGVVSWLNVGRVAMRKGEYARAEAAIKRAMTLATETQQEKLEGLVWSHIYLGKCYDLMGRRDMAVKEYRLVLELKNNYRGALAIVHKYLNKPFTKEDF
jgi:Transglutaminase-like superfamily/Tetratricopeptide repeat